MKKQPRKNIPETSASGGAPTPAPGDRSTAPPSPLSALRAPHSALPPPPSLRQTAGLILLAWGALAVFVLLWRLWTKSGLIVLFSALVIGLGFTLAALFDHLWRRFGEKP